MEKVQEVKEEEEAESRKVSKNKPSMKMAYTLLQLRDNMYMLYTEYSMQI